MGKRLARMKEIGMKTYDALVGKPTYVNFGIIRAIRKRIELARIAYEISKLKVRSDLLDTKTPETKKLRDGGVNDAAELHARLARDVIESARLHGFLGSQTFKLPKAMVQETLTGSDRLVEIIQRLSPEDALSRLKNEDPKTRLEVIGIVLADMQRQQNLSSVPIETIGEPKPPAELRPRYNEAFLAAFDLLDDEKKDYREIRMVINPRTGKIVSNGHRDVFEQLERVDDATGKAEGKMKDSIGALEKIQEPPIFIKVIDRVVEFVARLTGKKY